MSEVDDVCVVTQPVSSASEPHVQDILEIIGAITTVSLMTANLPDNSSIRKEWDVIDIASVGTGSSIPVAAGRFLRNQIRMARMLRRRNESVVLFFGATSYLLPILIVKLSGKTVVLQPRGNVPLTLRLHWEQRVQEYVARVLAGSVWVLEHSGYRLADAIVTYTPTMATELGLDRYKSKLYPNGARYVDTDRFNPRIPYGERDLVVGFLGRLDEEKGIRELAAVAKQLPDDVTFVFAGDGELRGWLERELSEEIKSGDVEMTGWVDRKDVPDVLSRFRLLVLPSQPTEGLPTVILEAFACGTPVYATPVSGVPDVVREGETGFLMEEVDGRSITAEIERVMDQEDLEKISRKSRQMVEEEYSFEAAIRRYENILLAL